MGIERSPEALIKGLRNVASNLTHKSLVHGLFIDIVGTDTSLGRISKRYPESIPRFLTLIVVELVWMVTIQLPQYLDHIGIGIGTTEGISRAVKAQDELLGLRRVNGLSVRHCEYQKEDKSKEAKRRRNLSLGEQSSFLYAGDSQPPSSRSQSCSVCQ